jgi:hypothetical protein
MMWSKCLEHSYTGQNAWKIPELVKMPGTILHWSKCLEGAEYWSNQPIAIPI